MNRCTNCGAQLTPEALAQPGCPYCGAALPYEVRAAERAAVAKELLADRDGDGIPDALEGLVDGRARAREVQAAPAPVAPTPAKSSSGASVGAAILGLMLLVGGAGVAVWSLLSEGLGVSKAAGVSKALGVSSGPGAWSASAPGCAVDANGDGVDDHVGLSGEPADTKTLTLVDGSTGEVLHLGDEYESSKVYCLDADWFVVAQPSFELDFFRAREPAAPVRIAARDRLRAMGRGEGCVAVETADGNRAGYQLPGGTSVECKVPSLRRVLEDPPGVLGMPSESAAIDAGDRTIVVSKRKRGTAVLTVTVREGERRLWSRELPYVSTTTAAGVAVGKGTIVLWGAKPGKEDQGILIGLSDEDGRQLYAHPQRDGISNGIEFMAFNGKYVVVQWWIGLHAYEPTTGEEVWHVGG